MATRNKITEIIAGIKAVYPYYAKDNDVVVLVKTWEMLLRPYDDKTVDMAFFMCLQSCKMPPTPADLIEKIQSLKRSLAPTEEELWHKLVDVLKECAYLSDCFGFTGIDKNGKSQGQNARKKTLEYWENMPLELKSYCGSYGEMMRMADNFDESDKFEKNRFLKRISIISKEQDVRNFAQLNGFSGNNLLKGE